MMSEGESAEGKAIKVYQTQAVMPQAGAGAGEAWLCGLPSSPNPPQASADG